MKKTLTLDSAGRLVIPLPVRKQFQLVRGSALELEVRPDAIVLRPQSHPVGLVEQDGLLVHQGEPAGDLLNAIEMVRGQRDSDLTRLLR
ncbi:MAG: AbrB/MazE/SpoVT family DNA-binding domain-containing protein [Planctomycetes bacterium]|nr:AbrB/MazE/SpoVT family DNA-binding domain-containing protein [Planctomycetota bacterium]